MRFFLKIFNYKTFKSLVKFVFIVLFICFLVLSPKFVFDKSRYFINLENILNEKETSKTVLSLYNIQSFEGGTNSIDNYLKKQAINFNKRNKNCFIMISSLSVEQLLLNLQEENLPDLFTFSCGIGEYISGYLSSLEQNNNIRRDLQEFGTTGQNCYAYPFIMSGYVLCSYDNLISDNENLSSICQNKRLNRKDYKGLSICLEEKTNPLHILQGNEITVSRNDLLENKTSYMAYKSFIDRKSISLLGTARDYARLKNRELNGTISLIKYNFLPYYNDLIQYVSVCRNKNPIKEKYAKEFAKFLTLENAQTDIKNYGLFSVNGKKLYDEEGLSQFENIVTKNFNSINVFASNRELINDKKLLLEKLK